MLKGFIQDWLVTHIPFERLWDSELSIIFLITYLADAFIQSDLQSIRLSRGQSPLEKCGVPVMYLSH